jgi:PAS domain S-box-containing protein
VGDLVNELAYTAADGDGDAHAWLDRLRRVVQASEAVLWNVSEGARATAVVHAGTAVGAQATRREGVDVRRTTVDRVRRLGLIACGTGDVSGVEDFVPPGVASFVLAGANRMGRLAAVLVLGWSTPLPSCGAVSFGELRVAAALLDRTLAAGGVTSGLGVTTDPVVRAMDAGIAVLDRHGAIMAATTKRTAPRGRHGDERTSREPISSLDLCREATAAGSAEACAAVNGIASVASGASDFFQAVCRLPEPPGQRWTIMTATPLQPADGAVVVHCDLVEETIAELTRRFGDRRFVQLLDALPLAVWIATDDGRVTCANRQWTDSVAGATASSRSRQWLDAVHPDDRAGAAAAFAAAVSRRECMQVEVRLLTADGSYRWFSCIAERLAAEPGPHAYLGVCIDISNQRHAQASRDALASKVLVAQEAERSRCARDLHDELGHQVVLLDVALDTAMRQPWSRTQSLSTMRAARARLQEIAGSIHALAHRLHPAKLRLLGLAATLQALCRDIAAESSKAVDFVARDVPTDIDETVAVSLFRITQEALQNAVKHSGGPTIAVQLLGAGDTLHLRIVDDGGGFDPLTVRSAGLGLMTMRERVELLMGGTLAITTAPGHGTTIDVVVGSRNTTSSAPRPADHPAPGHCEIP